MPAAAIAGTLPVTRPSSLSCPISFTVERSRSELLFLPDSQSCLPRAWCALRVIPSRTRNSSSVRHRFRPRVSVSGKLNSILIDFFCSGNNEVTCLSDENDDELFTGPGSDPANLDDFLEFAETFFIAPAAVLAVGNLVNLSFPGAIKPLQSSLGRSILAWQFVFLVGAVVIGRTIRVRQWRRFCRENGTSVNLMERIEKVEKDLRSSTTIVRILSRQLEKLGIRFRVTRRTLKDPISQVIYLPPSLTLPALLIRRNSKSYCHEFVAGFLCSCLSLSCKLISIVLRARACGIIIRSWN